MNCKNINTLSNYFDLNYFDYRFINQQKLNYKFFVIKNNKNVNIASIIYKVILTSSNKKICVIIDILTKNSFLRNALLIFRLNFNELIYGYSYWCNKKYKNKLYMNGFFKYNKIPIIFYNNKQYNDLIVNNKLSLNFKISTFDVY